MSSVLSLPLKPPFSLYHLHQPRTLSAHRFSLRSHSQSSLSFLKFRIRDSSSSDFDREESRWLREEQRWLREEQRWLREEQRWLREEQRWLREEQRWFRDRDSLLHEISDLKLQIEALELQVSSLGQGGASASETVARVAALLQALKDKNRIAESGTGASPLVLKEIEDKEVVVEEVVRVSKGEAQQKMKTKKERRTLRKGAEGDEVRELQEALQKLGFYSGEEDTEFSSFASGTERAVKTWQSSLDIPEDGIMTAELRRRLYMEQPSEGAGANFSATAESRRPFRALLDVGLIRTTTGNRVFGALKGALDGGLDIPHSEKRFAGFSKDDKNLDAEVHRKYIYGGHVVSYMQTLMEDEPEKYQSQFSDYIKRGIESDGIEAMYTKVHAAIRADPTMKKSGKPQPTEHKRYNLKKLTYEERKAKLVERLNALNSAAGVDESEDED